MMNTALAIISIFATMMLTVEGLWIIYTTREHRHAKYMMTQPAEGKKKRICVIIPTYKDIVELDKWLNWSKGESNVHYIIAEDVSHTNDKFKNKATIIHRSERTGFKAGAVNNVFDYLSKQDVEYDYVMIFDADHVPYNDSVKQIYDFLNKEIIQFFWLDGLPLKTPLNWITYSSRYYSNWNIYNREFSNLTGSSIAIRFDLIKKEHLRYPETITEDYALTLHSINERKLRVTVVPYILSIGSSPKSFKGYLRQQIRWAEGTVRDAKKCFWEIMDSPAVSSAGKLDFLMHLNMYLQGMWLLMTLAIFLLFGLKVVLITSPIWLFQLVAYFKTLAKTPKKYWALYFGMNYLMAFLQVYALYRGLFISDGVFMVTDKNTLPSPLGHAPVMHT